MKNYEQKFCDYMSIQNKSQSTINSYSVGISKYIDPCIKDNIDNSHTSIYNIIDVEALDILQSKLYKNKEFYALNTEKHNRFSSALKQYIEFANSYIDFEVKSNNTDVIIQETKDLTLKEIDNIIVGLTKGGIAIPHELIEKKLRLESSKKILSNLPAEILTRLEDLFFEISDNVSISLKYSPNNGLCVDIADSISAVDSENDINNSIRNKLKVTLENGTVIQCPKVKDTLIEVVKLAGIENVKELNIKATGTHLIENFISDKLYIAQVQYEIATNLYLNTL